MLWVLGIISMWKLTLHNNQDNEHYSHELIELNISLLKLNTMLMTIH